MPDFLMPTGPEARDFLVEIAEEMVTLFHVSRGEAIARINAAWRGLDFTAWPDPICHEEPAHWAYSLYFEDDVPYWQEDFDPLVWPTREPPAKDAKAWTALP